MSKKIIQYLVLPAFFVAGSVFVQAYTSEDGSINDFNTINIKKRNSTNLQEEITEPFSGCVNLKSNNLYYRSSDRISAKEVTVVQNFLVSQGLLNVQPSGYFGTGTFAAVKRFQSNYDLNPTGYVGSLTKAKIKEITCHSDSGNSFIPMPEAPNQTFPKMCTMEARLCSNGQAMKRDNNCVWLESSCFATSTEDKPIHPKPLAEGACLTMDYRVCSNGKIMPRGGDCVWRQDLCSATVENKTITAGECMSTGLNEGKACNENGVLGICKYAGTRSAKCLIRETLPPQLNRENEVNLRQIMQTNTQVENKKEITRETLPPVLGY